jgi:hypothetical protein
MAAKKARRARKPEKVVGAVKAGGKLEINTEELEQFLKGLKMKKPKVQFVARNAPFMRRAPIPTG